MRCLNHLGPSAAFRAARAVSFVSYSVLFIAFALKVLSQNSTSLASADYFWDTDLVTNHVPVAVSPDETIVWGFPSTHQLNFKIDGLSPGIHQLGFRVQNSTGNWSDVNWLPVEIYDSANVSAAVGNLPVNDSGSYLVYGECFLDHEPWVSNGIPIIVASGETLSSGYPVASTNLIDVSSIDPGLHQLGFRTIDNQGRISATLWLPLQVYDPTNILVAIPTIFIDDFSTYLQYVERFWDYAPEMSNGVPINVAPGEVFAVGYPSIVSNYIDLSSLSAGLHQLGVRIVDGRGRVSATNWLPVEIYDGGTPPAPVPISTITDEAAKLVYIQYFLDNEPEPGNGALTSISADESFTSGYPGALTNFIDLSSLDAGSHQLGFRTIDEQGRYSVASWLPLEIYEPTNVSAATINVAVNDNDAYVTSLEAFWDVAPTFGRGIPMGGGQGETFASGYPTTVTNDFDLSLFDIGIHLLGMRAINNRGQISSTNWLPVQIYDPLTIGIGASNVVVKDTDGMLSRVEYFWDNDPGLGYGIPIVTNLMEEIFSLGFPGTATFSLDATSLSGGNHRLGVRTMDLVGRWSDVNWLPIRAQFPPFITMQPSSLYLIAGASGYFSVGAGGAPPLGYQWYHDDVALPGATGQILSVNGVQPTNEGSYFVVVENLDGGTRSLNAQLILGIAPQISLAPTNIEARIGGQGTFSVSASGTNLFFQWQFGSVNIPGGTGSSLVLSNLTEQQAGQYTVIVSNLFGQVRATASLTVTPLQSGFLAMQQMAPYVSLGTNCLNCLVSIPPSNQLYTLLWQPVLPTNWKIVSVQGDGSPELIAGQIVFTAATLPNPLRFSIWLTTALNQTGTNSVSASVYYWMNGMQDVAVTNALPDPLLVPSAVRHDADYKRDYWVIDAQEVIRTLAYWRAGSYHIDTNTADGFSVGPGNTNGALYTADYEAPFGVIDASEVNRVLAYWRAGAYHPDASGFDGYSAGPMVPAPSNPPFKPLQVSLVSSNFGYTESGPDLYVPQGSINITNTVSYTGTLLSLLWNPHLPPRWALMSATSPGTPVIVDGRIVWTDEKLPNSPFQFVYTVQGPANDHATHNLSAEVEYQLAGSSNPTIIKSSEVPPLTLATVQMGPARILGNRIVLGLFGENGLRYYIQRSNDLVTWQTFVTVTAVNGQASIEDVLTDQQSFYRAVLAAQ